MLFDYLAAHGVPAMLVATKLDRLPKSKQKPSLDKLKKETGVNVIGTSAETRVGIDRLLEAVVRACGFMPPSNPI